MAQIKIYGVKEHLNPVKAKLSNVIHSCVVDALSFPQDKRAHRFFPLEEEDFYYPIGRTPRYTIVEISMFEGRSVETKKDLICLLFERTQRELDSAHADLEMTIIETPKHNWVFEASAETKPALTTKLRSDRSAKVELIHQTHFRQSKESMQRPATAVAGPRGRSSKEGYMEDEYTEISNESAIALVRKVRTRNGVRMEVHSPRLDYQIYLDPPLLESLTWQTPQTFSKFLEEPYGPRGTH